MSRDIVLIVYVFLIVKNTNYLSNEGDVVMLGLNENCTEMEMFEGNKSGFPLEFVSSSGTDYDGDYIREPEGEISLEDAIKLKNLIVNLWGKYAVYNR